MFKPLIARLVENRFQSIFIICKWFVSLSQTDIKYNCKCYKVDNNCETRKKTILFLSFNMQCTWNWKFLILRWLVSFYRWRCLWSRKPTSAREISRAWTWFTRRTRTWTRACPTTCWARSNSTSGCPPGRSCKSFNSALSFSSNFYFSKKEFSSFDRPSRLFVEPFSPSCRYTRGCWSGASTRPPASCRQTRHPAFHRPIPNLKVMTLLTSVLRVSLQSLRFTRRRVSGIHIVFIGDTWSWHVIAGITKLKSCSNALRKWSWVWLAKMCRCSVIGFMKFYTFYK